MCRLAISGVNLLFCPGGTVVPGRLPPVEFVNGLESETLCRSENDRTSRADPPLFSLPMSRCVSEYWTEFGTTGRNGVSTVSNRMMRCCTRSEERRVGKEGRCEG